MTTMANTAFFIFWYLNSAPDNALLKKYGFLLLITLLN